MSVSGPGGTSGESAVGLAPLLVASDVDGTLLDSRDRVTERLRAVVGRVSSAGSVFTLATGRPARWLAPVLEQLPVAPVCVCANGAVLYDSAADVIVRRQTLPVEVQRELVTIADAVFAGVGGVGVAAERPGESAWDDPTDLFVCTPEYNQAWMSRDHGIEPVAGVTSEPATKLLLRNSALGSAEMVRMLAPHVPAEVASVTYSMPEGLIELACPGVSKASGLAWLAQRIGTDASRVIVFGDMPNDLEMLRWAGLGVAMGNAIEPVKAAADEVTASNDDYGVARVLERWF